MIMSKANIRYLNEDIINEQDKKKKRQIVAGSILTGFFLSATIACFTGSIEMKNLAVYLIALPLSIWPLILGITKARAISAARRYETIFGGDRNGVITVDELSVQMGKPGYKIFPELEKLFRRGYFQNCTLQQGGHPCVIIDEATDTTKQGVGFVTVLCPSCGATNSVRSGSYSKCSYCEAPLIGK